MNVWSNRLRKQRLNEATNRLVNENNNFVQSLGEEYFKSKLFSNDWGLLHRFGKDFIF